MIFMPVFQLGRLFWGTEGMVLDPFPAVCWKWDWSWDEQGDHLMTAENSYLLHVIHEEFYPALYEECDLEFK